MAIPKKPKASISFSSLLQNWQKVQPKQLVKLTALLFCCSIGTYYYFSEYRQHMRRMQQIREIELIRDRIQVRDLPESAWAKKNPTENYGMDFHTVPDNKSKSCDES